MATTTNHALRYPIGSDNNDTAQAFQNLAEDVDEILPGLIYEGNAVHAATASQNGNLTIDTEIYDVGTVGSVGSGTFTVPDAGIYLGIVEAELTLGPSGHIRLTLEITTGTAGPNISKSLTVVGSNSNSNRIFVMDASDVLTLSYEELTGSAGTIDVTLKIYKLGV